MKVVLEVFDSAMCCSTGVCGPDVDPKLFHFAADLDWLKGQGVDVRRYNLAHEPGQFVNHAAIKDLLASKGTAALPAIMANGQLVSSGRYLTRKDLAMAAGVLANAPAQGDVASSVHKPAGCGCGGACGPVTIVPAAKFKKGIL